MNMTGLGPSFTSNAIFSLVGEVVRYKTYRWLIHNAADHLFPASHVSGKVLESLQWSHKHHKHRHTQLKEESS